MTPRDLLLSDRFLNIAHRGGGHLAPEETLAAFDNAVAVGADVIELDVHATADGVVVVCHDETVDRTTNGSGAIREMSFEALRALDAGYHFTPDGGATYPYRDTGVVIPTLEEVLAALPGLPVTIEIKQHEPSIVEALLAVLDATGSREHTVIGSFLDTPLAEVRARAPDVLTGFGLADVFGFLGLTAESEADYAPPGQFLQVPVREAGFEVVTPESVARAHRVGLKVHVWTINDLAEVERLMALGVDGIMTDDPAMLAEAVVRRAPP